jgi:hypothetical protein
MLLSNYFQKYSFLTENPNLQSTIIGLSVNIKNKRILFLAVSIEINPKRQMAKFK